MKRTTNGFTLTEMSIVLLILGLVLGGLLPKLGTQLEHKQRTQTEQNLESSKQALLGFASSQGRLPCPASDSSNGQESFCDSASGSCNATTTSQSHGRCSHAHNGFIPYATLALNEWRDGWHQPLRYAVANNSVNSISNALTRPLGIKQAGISALTSTELLMLCYSPNNITASSCGDASNKYSDNLPALIYSTGARNNNSTSESANLNNDRVFIYRNTAINSNDNYDDQLSWLSPHILFYQMSQAGLLP